MPNRFWRGGTAAWDVIAGTKWADTVGGAGGASVPTSADDVFFDAASGTVTVTIASGNNGARSINCTGFTGTLTGTAGINVYGSVTLVPAMTYSHTGTITLLDSATLITAGKTFSGIVVGAPVALGDALNIGTRTLTVSLGGSLTTNNYNITAGSLSSNSNFSRSISLGSSTVTLSSTFSPLDFSNSSNLTFNAGTSSIFLSSANAQFLGGGNTFYNVSFASGLTTDSATLSGANTFQNLTFAATSFSGVAIFRLDSNQVVNGTLTLNASANSAARTFLCSNIIGTARTLTCNAVSALQDIDFRDIAFAGNCVSGGNLSGTRLGDCKGNSNITFGAGVIKYWNSVAGGNWSSTSWATTSGGTPNANNHPLAQDTCVFQSTGLNSGATVTIDAAYNIGTINMSARTSNTMTLSCTVGASVYGNWINGTGTTMSGGSPGRFTFVGRGSQTITSAGRTFTQAITVDSLGGSVTLQDAFSSSASSGVSSFQVRLGTFNDGGYNLNMSSTGSGFSTTGTGAKSLVINGVWSIGGDTFSNVSTGLTVSGSGSIRITSTSALKTFAGAGIQTWPTIVQATTSTLTITGSNRFKNITNTAVGRVQFTGGTTNQFDAFNLNGSPGNLLQLGSNNTTQVIIKKSSAWNVGANSTNGGNNTGLSFVAGGNDYLNISYVNGMLSSKIFLGSLNVASFFYGSTPVSAIYYGAIRVL